MVVVALAFMPDSYPCDPCESVVAFVFVLPRASMVKIYVRPLTISRHMPHPVLARHDQVASHPNEKTMLDDARAAPSFSANS